MPVKKPAIDERQIRNRYLARLINHVDARKFYPRPARRRGIEGVVHISFTLLKDGRIANLKVSDGHKLLRKAARQAVKKSLPLPVPPDSLKTPMAIRFGMEYRLR